MDYELDLDEVFAAILAAGHRLVALQLPEGMRDFHGPVAEAIESATGAAVVVSADPSYGACDLVDDEVLKLGADALVHVGHTEIPHLKKFERMPVYFVAARSTLDPLPQVEEALKHLIGPRVGILTTAQHLHTLPKVVEFLKAKGYNAVVAQGDARLAKAGQVLGCNYTSVTKDADSYLFVGSGNFHPLGLALNTKKRIVCADPYTRQVRTMDAERDRILRQRYAAIGLVRSARRFGIVASTKEGQLRWNMAKALQKRLRDRGHSAVLIALREIAPERLLHFRNLDAFVSTACPRVAIDDYERYPKPIVTPIELEMALGDRPLDEYRLDEIYGTSI